MSKVGFPVSETAGFHTVTDIIPKERVSSNLFPIGFRSKFDMCLHSIIVIKPFVRKIEVYNFLTGSRHMSTFN